MTSATASATIAADRARSAASFPAISVSRVTGSRLPSASSIVPETEATLRRRRRTGTREPPLRVARQGCEGRGEDRLDTEPLGAGEVGGQERERAPGEREPDVGVQAPAEELEVVREDEDRPGCDEREQPEVERDRAGDPDPDRGGDRHAGQPRQRRPGDPRAERTAAQLVERVGADPDREEEGGEGRAEPSRVPGRGERRADHDVAQVPERVREGAGA